jgi:hypothetical protein
MVLHTLYKQIDAAPSAAPRLRDEVNLLSVYISIKILLNVAVFLPLIF